MADGLKTIINPKYERLRGEIERIPDTIAGTGIVIYSDRNTIYRATIGGEELTVKAFHVPAPFNRLIYSTLRHSKARRSFDNAMELERLGIGTPEPIAYIEERRSGLLARSYYVCRMFTGQNIRHWETEIPDYRNMIRAFAAFTLDLHRKGVMHRDFSPGNILFNRKDDGAYRFVLVDINRMRFGVKNRRTLYRNFRCLNIDSEEETARIAEEYARIAGLDSEKMRRTAVRLLRSYHKEKARHRLLKRLFRRRQ